MESKYFVQESPKLGNQYLEDTALRELIQRVLPEDIKLKIEQDLIRFGSRILEDISYFGKQSELNPPQLVQYDAWGKRIDEVKVNNGWKQLQRIAAEEGIVSIGYERTFKEWSRFYQYVKVYLFAASSYVFDCPLSMTDGAARLIELWGTDQQKKKYLFHLISRDPNKFWTSGQWMTERTGGSDVGLSETFAKPTNKNGEYSITGFKFFTSAVTSDMTILLARTQNNKGESEKGSKGLSAFLVEIRDQKGTLNNILVHKMKQKLGTKAVPTAELELINTPGILIGPSNNGVKVISTILNITRIHNAINSISIMRRGIAIARDYAHRRQVFGKQLSNQPLHLTTLANLEIEYRSALQFTFNVVILHGKMECSVATNEEKILFRLLTPLLKLYTAKQAIAVSSECIEALGGTGYMEDSDLPRLLRDAQVLSIWEGTTNVLSLDVWRPIKSEKALEVYMNNIDIRLTAVKNPTLSSSVQLVRRAVEQINKFATDHLDEELEKANSRQFAFGLSRIYMAVLLMEQAEWSGNIVDLEIAKRWTLEKPLVQIPFNGVETNYIEFSKLIALDIDLKNKKPRGMGEIDPLGKQRSYL